MATIIGLADASTPQELYAAGQPFALSPIPGPGTKSKVSIFTRLLGPRFVRDLGTLTTSAQATADVPIVQRSWGVLGGAKFYGSRFHVEQYMKTRNLFTGIAIHFATVVLGALLLFSPFRWLAKKIVYAPGDGPAEEDTIADRSEMRGIAIPDSNDAKAPRGYCRAYFDGGIYHCKSFWSRGCK